MNDVIGRLKNSLYENAFKDIYKAMKAEAFIGAYILTSCLIDYIAGFRYHKNKCADSERYKGFVNNYLEGYMGYDLYTSLRCKLVHSYSEGGKYLLVYNRPDLHQTTCDNTKYSFHKGKTYINLENFVADVKRAMDIYFKELEENEELQLDAKNRIDTHSILGNYEIKDTSIANNSYNDVGSTANITASGSTGLII